jgi:hypothetical protein
MKGRVDYTNTTRDGRRAGLGRDSMKNADPYAAFLLRGVIGEALDHVTSADDEKRREAARWIFSKTSGPWSLEWVCRKAQARIEDVTGRRPGVPTPQSVRRKANERIREGAESGKLPAGGAPEGENV